jgi:hypothetical protein
MTAMQKFNLDLMANVDIDLHRPPLISSESIPEWHSAIAG